MKLNFSKADLLTAINKVQSIVPAKPVVPILSHILLKAENGKCFFVATDLTMSVKVEVPAHILQEGAALLPARAFFSLVREFPAVPIELSLQPQGVQILAGASRFKLHTMKLEEFPPFSLEGAGITEIALSQKVLQEALFQTSFAVCREDSRQTITGLWMQVNQGMVTLLGTDGKKLARKQLPIENSALNWQGVLPLKTVEEVQRLLGTDKEIRLLLSSDRLAAVVDGVEFTSKLMPGDYPDLSAVIPQSTPIEASLEREELMSLLRQVSLFISEQHPSARFSFSPGQLALTSNQSQLGEAQLSMSVQGVSKELQIAFNPSAFLDILKHSKAADITLGLTDSYNPGMIREGAHTLFILMPMRLIG